MTRIFMFLLIILLGCKPKLIPDPAPAPIDVGWKRVETIICSSWEVGENGCAFNNGILLGDLKIYRPMSGSISIIAQGCGVEKSFRYEDSGDEWISLDLKTLLNKTKIDSDCVMTIYQIPDLPGQDKAAFPVKGMYGTVTLGICPDKTLCGFHVEQFRLGWPNESWRIDTPESGTYTLRGCGKEIVPPTSFNAPLILNLTKLWPNGYPLEGKNECMFVLGVKSGEQRWKYYYKISLFKEETMKLEEPVFERKGDKVKFKGDPAVTYTIVNNEVINGSEGSFKITDDGTILRFYTVQGRSLVYYIRHIKSGEISWMK